MSTMQDLFEGVQRMVGKFMPDTMFFQETLYLFEAML